MENLLNAREAATVLGVHVRFVRTLAARGELPVVRLGRRTLFSPSSLAEFVRQHEERGGARPRASSQPTDLERASSIPGGSYAGLGG
jgi:excisionase family DNA binding protein